MSVGVVDAVWWICGIGSGGDVVVIDVDDGGEDEEIFGKISVKFHSLVRLGLPTLPFRTVVVVPFVAVVVFLIILCQSCSQSRLPDNIVYL